MGRPVRWLARVLLLIAAGVVLVMLVRVLGSGLPFVLVGYSMGGALAVDYVLEALDSSELPVPERLVLLSPAIGVSPAGILGSWHKALSWLPYFEKFRWLDILLEYDPFKYNSFPKNAGRQMFLRRPAVVVVGQAAELRVGVDPAVARWVPPQPQEAAGLSRRVMGHEDRPSRHRASDICASSSAHHRQVRPVASSTTTRHRTSPSLNSKSRAKRNVTTRRRGAGAEAGGRGCG